MKKEKKIIIVAVAIVLALIIAYGIFAVVNYYKYLPKAVSDTLPNGRGNLF